MQPDPDKPYYTAYEKRYQSAYAQGVRYWHAFPEETAEVNAQVGAFLDATGLQPGDAQVVEFGCGEGYVARMLAERGYRYTGMDLAPSAIARAEERLAPFAGRARVLVADIAHLSVGSVLPAGEFDAAMDVMCLHMLVVDADRQAYLRSACALLKPGAPMLFCFELWKADAYPHPVHSYEEWAGIAGGDYATPKEREAWHEGQTVKVMIPTIAARERTVDQYREEMEAAGFTDFALTSQPGPSRVSFRVKREA